MNYIVIDQGTSSTKAFLFNSKGQIIHNAKIKHILKNPKKFYFESDPIEILNSIEVLFKEMVNRSVNTPIKSAGLSIQRSTFMFWDKETKQPFTPAISWQDSRASSSMKNTLKHRAKLWQITGTPLSPHFGGPKFLHFVRNNLQIKKLIKDEKLFFGPLSSFLTHSMTNNVGIDNSIASRTILFNINKNKWSKYALNLFGVPESCLPPIVPVKHNYGTMFNSNIELKVVIGDQQAAFIGNNGLQQNTLAANYGTSASIQLNVGPTPKIINGLISSILFSNSKEKVFMVEGTINSCNSLFYYLEKKFNIDHQLMNWNERVKNIETDGIFIPGFSGIASPYWKTGFEDILIDLDGNINQTIRAAMESIGFLTYDILSFFKKNKFSASNDLIVSGGAARPSLLQFIANITRKNMHLTKIKDKTAYGVLKILSNQLDQTSKIRLNEKIIFCPKNKNKSKVEKWHKSINSYL
ncbi:MAG: FGGY family carbohydrate kinase [Candidatus Neomarinimicrobiota bacterium]